MENIMLRPTAKSVIPMNDFILHILLDNGEANGFFDVKPYIRGNRYGELINPAYFKSVFANGYTVE